MANNYVTKPYLQTQFQNYSEVIKDNFAKKDDVSTEKLEYTTTKDTDVTNVKEALDTLFSGGAGEGEENAIESISVNGTPIAPDTNKNVDITVPTISSEQDNALVQKVDGLYVPTVAEAKVSQEQNNIIVSKEDGLFAENTIIEIKVDGVAIPITDKTVDIALKTVTDLENYYDKEEVDDLLEAITTLNISVVDVLPTTGISTTTIYLVAKTDTEEQNIYSEYICLDATVPTWECIGDTKVDLTEYAKTDDVEKLIEDELYISSTTPAHYEIADSSTPNALEVVADGTATDGQIDLSNVADIGASIGDYVVFVDEVTTTDSKYAEKADTYTKSEVDQKITDAVTSGTVDLSGYTTDEELSDALADYTKTTDLETQLEDYVLDSDMEIIDLATLESMLGLSTEELEGLASLLSDQTIELSKTWSSSKIYSELNSTLDTAKQYTLDELSKAIGASYKVVTSVDQMTDSKVLYLLKDTDSGMYNIYVYDADTSTAELIGSFEINLDDYYTKAESENLFASKSDVTANYATKTELQEAIEDVQIEIATTLDVDSTDTQVPSAKAVYDELQDIENNYLPLTGGTQYKNVSIYNHISTDLRDVLYGIDHNGALIVKDDTNGKYIIVSSADGETTLYGNLNGTASGNLPLAGGKLTGNVILQNGSDFTAYRNFRTQGTGETIGTQVWTGTGGCAQFALVDETAELISLLQLGKKKANFVFENQTYDVLHTGNVKEQFIDDTSTTAEDKTWSAKQIVSSLAQKVNYITFNGENYNDMPHTGRVTIVDCANTGATNSPKSISGSNQHIVLYFYLSDDYRAQYAFGFGGNGIAKRNCSGSTTWSEWSLC